MVPRVDVQALALLLFIVPSLYDAHPTGGRGHHRTHHQNSQTDNQAPSAWPEPINQLARRRSFHTPTSQENTDKKTFCPECKRNREQTTLSQNEVNEIRIAMIKKQILSKLKLSAPPNITRRERPSHLPAPLHSVEEKVLKEEHHITGTRNRGKEEFFGKTTEVVVFGNEGKFLFHI